jgi:hypothetical protein
LNGRYIDNATTGWTTNGWDKPQLIDTATYTTSVLQSGQIPLPDWIYVTTNGRKSPAITAPEPDVVGRYAYVVYDEGGLLDVNVAGYPSSVSSPDARDPARKGPLALADLTKIPGAITSAMQDALIAWRNKATSSAFSANTYTYPVTNSPSYIKYALDSALNKGNTPIYPGDQKFLSREELLAYSAANPTILPAQSLAYLGTFTRTDNAPTWRPTATIGNPVGCTTDYAGLAEQSGQAPPIPNRDIINVRWPADVTIKNHPVLGDDTGTLTETVTFHKGDPVVQRRFPLSKLQLLAHPTAANANAILYYFGLVWFPNGNPSLSVNGTGTTSLPSPGATEAHWEYVHSNQDSANRPSSGGFKYINSIDEVAAMTKDPTFGSREPDFFEMLRAGILMGSADDVIDFDTGISIIDQTTPTDGPSELALGTGENADGSVSSSYGAYRLFLGRKSLPYFMQMLFWPYRPRSDSKRDTFEAYLVPMLWNPHRNASSAASSDITNFQIILYDTRGATIWGIVGGGNSFNYDKLNNPNPAPGFATLPGLNSSSPPAPITFSNSADFSEPTILGSKYVTSAAPAGSTALNGSSEPANNRWGFFLGSRIVLDSGVAAKTGQNISGISTSSSYNGTPTTWPACTAAYLGASATSDGTYFRLQYQGSDGNWHTYDEFGWGALNSTGSTWAANSLAGATIGGSTATATPCFADYPTGSAAYNYYPAISFGRLDPRFNVVTGSGKGRVGTALWTTSLLGSVASPLGSTWRPDHVGTPLGAPMVVENGSSTAQFTFGLPASISAVPPVYVYPSKYAENSDTSNPGMYQYSDNAVFSTTYSAGDGVIRPADGATGAYPMDSNKIQDRPIVLNRPFRSVGELGYAYRGVEWKTVDFSSASSADAGLLDLFSVSESPIINGVSLEAGVVNINTRNPVVLQALLSGTLQNDLDTSAATVISSAQALTIANAIVTETSANPLLNRSELATRVMSLSGVTAASGTATPQKTQREAVVRALAEPADTRTWNLLIDLVVQAGRYPPTAINAGTPAALSQFDVQGERRYWLHVAIDRYTGKVIDEQLEVVHDN